MGTKKRHEYFTGDKMIFRIKGEPTYRTDEILGFGEKAIQFETGAVRLKDIEKVSLANKKGLLRGVGTQLIIAGVGYMIIDLFNKTIIQGDFYFDGKVARSAGIITGTGAVLVVLSKKRVGLNKNWRLRIVDI